MFMPVIVAFRLGGLLAVVPSFCEIFATLAILWLSPVGLRDYFMHLKIHRYLLPNSG